MQEKDFLIRDQEMEKLGDLPGNLDDVDIRRPCDGDNARKQDITEKRTIRSETKIRKKISHN